MSGSSWPSDWVRAGLPLAALAALAVEDAHGYVLLQRLRSAGFDDLTGSTLYPLLSRQTDLGRLVARWDTDGAGPARRVFSITSTGRDELSKLAEGWRRFAEVVRINLTTVTEESK